jgi:short-subunit dehydrogenase
VLSVASWVNGGELAAYSASKSAAWSLTNALRHELADVLTQQIRQGLTAPRPIYLSQGHQR